MITLTTPITISSQIGGSGTNAYNKLRIVSINADPFSMSINAQVQLMVSSNASAPIISGNLSIIATGGSPVCTLQVPSLDFYSGDALSGAQVTTVQGWITGLQNNIESGIVSLGMAAGVQTTGT